MVARDLGGKRNRDGITTALKAPAKFSSTKAGKEMGNRFLTRQTCEATCQPSQDVCELPKIVGPCKDRIQQYWYDKDKDACFTFLWGEFHQKVNIYSFRGKITLSSDGRVGGCQGNGNRFEGLDFCEAACKKSGARKQARHRERRPGPLGALVDICNLPMDDGKINKV